MTNKQEGSKHRRLNMEGRSGHEIKKSCVVENTCLCLFLPCRQTYRVLNVRHMIYDYHSTCLCISCRQKISCSHFIHGHHSSCLCIRDINTVSIMLDISLWSSFFMCISSGKYTMSINVRHIFYDHRSSCLCLPDINTLSWMFDIITELCALVNKPSGASAGASDLKY